MISHKLNRIQGSSEQGFSLVEVMVALAILGIVVVATTQAIVNSSSARKIAYDRTALTGIASNAGESVLYETKQVIEQAITKKQSVLANLKKLTPELSGAITKQRGKGIAARAAKIPSPPETVVNFKAYKDTIKRCEASPKVVQKSLYVCVKIAATDPGQGHWNQADPNYPTLVEVMINPFTEGGVSSTFENLHYGTGTGLKSFFNVIWVGKQIGSAPAAVQWTAKERYAPL